MSMHTSRNSWKWQLTEQGFGLVGGLLIVVVVALVAGAGAYLWHKDHSTEMSIGNSSSKSGSSTTTGTTTTPDPYAGWKTYCDSTYHYCFKYPSGWTLDVGATAEQPCDAGAAALKSPSGSLVISYINANNHDQALSSFTAVSVKPISLGGQDLSIIGGYGVYGSGYLPTYSLADAATLNTYPVTVGQTSNFPTTARFADQGTGDSQCSGSFLSQPLQQLNTATDAKAWLDTADAKTSLQILESLSFR